MPEEPKKFSLVDNGGGAEVTLAELREVTCTAANWFGVLQMLCGSHSAKLRVKDDRGESHDIRIHDTTVINLGRF